MANEVAGEQGGFYNPLTGEMGYMLDYPRVHCTGRITSGKHPKSVSYNAADHTITETYTNADGVDFTEVYTFTVTSSGVVSRLAFPDGAIMSLEGFSFDG